jgi:hypothetical protein
MSEHVGDEIGRQEKQFASGSSSRNCVSYVAQAGLLPECGESEERHGELGGGDVGLHQPASGGVHRTQRPDLRL